MIERVKLYGLLAFILLLSSCGNNAFNLITKKAAAPQNKPLLVAFFLHPDCPITQKYTKTINELFDTFNQRANFVGIISGKHYTDQQISDFKSYYKIKMPLIKDEDYAIAKKLSATVYPQVFLLNGHSEILYDGKIDNWFETVGVQRQNPTQFYLTDAINASLISGTIKIKHTNPVGCYINYGDI